MLASPSPPTVLRSRPAPRARPARCPPALRSQQPETSAPRPWCARGAQVLPHVLPGILSLSGPRESIPGPGLPETNAKLVARRDGRLAYYTQRRAGVPRNSSGGPPPGRAARPGDSSRAEETPPPDAARRFRDASAAGAVPARGPQHAGVALMRAKPGRPLLAARALLPDSCRRALFLAAPILASCSKGRPRTCLPVASTPAVWALSCPCWLNSPALARGRGPCGSSFSWRPARARGGSTSSGMAPSSMRARAPAMTRRRKSPFASVPGPPPRIPR